MATLYKLTLAKGYPQDTHHRAGLVLQRGGVLVTELSKDQLEAVKNDQFISYEKAKPGDESQAAPSPEDEGAGVTHNQHVGPDAPDRTASEETAADEDLGAESEETTSGGGAGAPAADVAGTVPTEPVSGELDSQAGAGAGAEPAEGLTPTEPVSGEAGSEQAPGSDASEGSDAGSSEEAAVDSTAAQLDPAAGQDNAQDEEVTADTLVRDHSRDELNAMAVKEGVSNAADLDNKQQVATAIMKIRAAAGN